MAKPWPILSWWVVPGRALDPLRADAGNDRRPVAPPFRVDPIGRETTETGSNRQIHPISPVRRR